MKTHKGTAALTNITNTPFVVFVGDDGTAYAGPFVVVAKFVPGQPVQVDAQPGTPPQVIQEAVNAMAEVKTAADRRIILA